MSEDQGIHEDFKDLYENAPCGYLSFLNDGSIITINQTLLTWLDLDRQEALTKTRFQDLLPMGERIFFETQFRPLLQVQKSVQEVQFNFKTKRETRVPVLTSTRLVFSADGKTQVNRMSVFCIEDRKKFETELKLEKAKAEAAGKAKTEFLSMLSHEIRTPLNAVIGVSNLLEGTVLSPEQTPFMEMLRTSSENLMNLLNSILDLSKIESGKVRIDVNEFQLRKFIEGNVLAWQGVVKKKGIELKAEIDPTIPASAVGDPVKITQILSNLLGNAIKFTSKGSVNLNVRLLALSKTEMTLKFAVKDSGIGIKANKLAMIFEEFSQAELDTTTRFGGTGLGLAISQKLAKILGSHINVESTEGVGSTFSFDLVLPVGDPKAQTHGIERVANQTDALKGLFVLVADDSEDNLTLMKHLFKKWGATLEIARNGREAVECVRGQSYDVVLMDINMPVMNGRDAAAAIRSLPDLTKQKLPIVVFSGSSSYDGHELTEDKLFTAVIGKPFRPLDLIATLLSFVKV